MDIVSIFQRIDTVENAARLLDFSTPLITLGLIQLLTNKYKKKNNKNPSKKLKSRLINQSSHEITVYSLFLVGMYIFPEGILKVLEFKLVISALLFNKLCELKEMVDKHI